MTPEDVVEALRAHEFDRIRDAASPEFRAAISSNELQRVWSELEASLGPARGAERAIVMHDFALECDRGDAHLQVVYEDGTITGLVLLNGPPTGQFGR